MSRQLAFAISLSITACVTTSFEDNVYRQDGVAYRVGALPPSWRRVNLRGAQLTLHHELGGTILANASCEPEADVPIDVLVNHALFDVEDRRELSRWTRAIDGRGARVARVDGELDGVPIALEIVVIKKDACVYDFELAASPEDFPAREPDFRRFYSGFEALAESP